MSLRDDQIVLVFLIFWFEKMRDSKISHQDMCTGILVGVVLIGLFTARQGVHLKMTKLNEVENCAFFYMYQFHPT
jgi:hypothetical protein